MCGIMGYIGDRDTTKVILEGLAKHEYRGYDSAGIAVIKDNKISELRTIGRVSALAERVAKEHFTGDFGIGHTRWATHGGVTENNAHPHVSSDNRVVLVHNGIIENAREIRADLEAHGIKFHTETDTESAVQYLGYVYDGDPKAAIVKLTKRIRGAFALVIMFYDKPNEIWVARKGSPLVVGHAENEGFCASDPTALLEYTRDVWFMDDDEMAQITKEGCKFFDFNGVEHPKESMHLDWDAAMTNRGAYPHFMLKEIHEQPKALRATISPRIRNGRVVLDDLSLTEDYLRGLRRIYIVACGSAYYVGCVGKYVIEKTCRIPVEPILASEFRYSEPVLGDDTLVIIISQSGETADTLAATRSATSLGARTLAIVNVVGSAISKAASDVIYTWAGPEIAVATTKAYSTQLSVIYLISLYMAQTLGTLLPEQYDAMVKALVELPDQMEKMLTPEYLEEIRVLAEQYKEHHDVFFIGRNVDSATCLEGSLKLKEIAYVHSEAYAAGELKHGPISLIEDNTLVIALATVQELFEKTMSNVKEVKARGANVLGVTTARNEAEIAKSVDRYLLVPQTHPVLQPSLNVVPLQIFAYYVALARDCDVDKPRNLAKSVTVE